MSINDPHLEAQMETEARLGLPSTEDSPPSFGRRQLWVFSAVAALGLIAWILRLLK